jgi:glycosyltransferase involved in cell wall biosynthesis
MANVNASYIKLAPLLMPTYRCIQSVVSIADEIIVVINDCTDNTKILAEK